MRFLYHINEIREEIRNDKNFWLTSMSTRENLEDTYSQHLHKTGLAHSFRYRVILALIYKDYKKLFKNKK